MGSGVRWSCFSSVDTAPLDGPPIDLRTVSIRRSNNRTAPAKRSAGAVSFSWPRFGSSSASALGDGAAQSSLRALAPNIAAVRLDCPSVSKKERRMRAEPVGHRGAGASSGPVASCALHCRVMRMVAARGSSPSRWGAGSFVVRFRDLARSLEGVIWHFGAVVCKEACTSSTPHRKPIQR